MVLFVAFALRLAVLVAMDAKGGALGRGFDSAAACEFTGMARGLLHHGTFTYFEVGGHAAPSAYQPPLYPLFFAGVFATLGDGTVGFAFVQLLQVALGVLAVWQTWRLTRELASEGIAQLALWLAALWPTLLYAPVEAHSVSLQIVLILAVCILLVRILKAECRPGNAWFLGVAMGLLSITRSEVIVLLPVLAVALWLSRRPYAGRAALAMCVCVLIPTGLWVGRNVRDLGRPALTTTAGLNLWRGNGEVATGGSYRWNGDIAWDTPATAAAVKALPWSPDYESQVDGVYASALKSYLSAAPLRPLQLLPIKLAFFLTSDLTHPKGKSPLVVLPALVGLPFFLVGARALWKRRQVTWPVLVWIGLYLLVSLVTFPLPRYRLTVEPLIIAATAVGVGSFYGRAKRAIDSQTPATDSAFGGNSGNRGAA